MKKTEKTRKINKKALIFLRSCARMLTSLTSEEQMEERYIEESVRLRLILSGMAELSEHGLADFSLRRAALGAQVSCAAPYRHFKDKDEYIREIVSYVASRWQLLAREIEKAFHDDPARLIVELCMANLRFYIANPNYRTVLTMTHSSALDSSLTEAVCAYARAEGLTEEEIRLAEYTVRVTVIGTVMLVGSADTEELLTYARKRLEREF